MHKRREGLVVAPRRVAIATFLSISSLAVFSLLVKIQASMADRGSGGIDEIFKSTLEDMVKMPEKESNHLTPATRLLEKRREMAEVEQALASQKEEFQLKMETLQQRRDELERKEQQLKESLLKFDKFLKENDLKRGRALKKTKTEQELGRQKDKEIERLGQELQEHSAIVKEQKNDMARYAACKQFMESVIDYSDEFDEVHEVIARYSTLEHTREDLMENERESQDLIEIQRASMKKFTDDKNNEVLACNNELAHLQTRLEEAQTKTMKWESEWIRIQTTSTQKTLLLGQIKMATHNLSTLMYKHLQRRVPAHEAEQTLLQLDKLQTFLKDLTEITHEIQRHESAIPNQQLLRLQPLS